MLPQPMSWSEPREDDPNPLAQTDLAQALEHQIAAGFPPGLALDLVLNELVVRAATATRASAAALALRRGEEMVCRAATGEHAPDLGIPLNTSDGVSGACLRTRQSQLCLDTETDPRVDAATCRRLGIRSMLVVPVLESEELVGVLEVFSTNPAEFVESDQNLLEIFARECARIRRAALALDQRPAAALQTERPLLPFSRGFALPEQKTRAPYEIWTLALGTLAILLTIALSFMIGSRIGWLGRSSSGARSPTAAPAVEPTQMPAPQTAAAKQSPGSSGPTTKSSPASNAGGLVVYEQGKVIFRMKPAPPQTAAEPAAPGSGEATPGGIARVWLAADLAESRLRHRIEPQYPAEALAAHRTGEVVLEVLVGEDGAVASMREVSGDPLLAAAAADAVRTWRYEPYRVQGRPAEFQTDVTLKFSLPD
ncbi:MAG: TonB family protein [Acidobacteriales bacterium]|nr:TonB family protein [Terriglobales bacterium]